MLRIYSYILETLALLRPLIDRIARRDADLARQMRRAAASIALNVAEGYGSRGRNAQARYHTALGSARETLACLDVAAALGYLPEPSRRLRERFDHIQRTLYCLAHPRPSV